MCASLAFVRELPRFENYQNVKMNQSSFAETCTTFSRLRRRPFISANDLINVFKLPLRGGSDAMNKLPWRQHGYRKPIFKMTRVPGNKPNRTGNMRFDRACDQCIAEARLGCDLVEKIGGSKRGQCALQRAVGKNLHAVVTREVME